MNIAVLLIEIPKRGFLSHILSKSIRYKGGKTDNISDLNFSKRNVGNLIHFCESVQTLFHRIDSKLIWVPIWLLFTKTDAQISFQ